MWGTVIILLAPGHSRRAERQAPMLFSAYRDNFDAETLAILEAAFNEAWEVAMTSGGDFDPGATRKALGGANH